MQVSTILNYIDNGFMALPKFQRGYVWNRDQVRAFMDSLYRRHPVGSLLVWVTSADTVSARGSQELAPGVVRLLLDGQQRVTSLYGIIRGEPPAFFDGDERAFTGLYFHLGKEEFQFYQKARMTADPLWIDVSALLKSGADGIGEQIDRLTVIPEAQDNLPTFFGRLNQLLGIGNIEFQFEDVTGADKTLDIVVDIFNRVNTGGTKLSQGDLALAKICGSWPEGRERMQSILKTWEQSGYEFTLDWLLRNMNAVVTGEARFLPLHDTPTPDIQDGLVRTQKYIDHALNLIADRLGLDHDRVLFGRNALPIMSRYIHKRGGRLTDGVERDRLLYWYLQSAMWGRFSGSTESTLDQDLEALEDHDRGIDNLLEQLRLWRGNLRVEPAHFRGSSIADRFYPVLYTLTRVGKAKNFCDGIALRRDLLGRMSSLEVHHIFPKAVLRRNGHDRSQVNAVANYCFLTKDCNLKIGARPPSEYFPVVAEQHPGALESQWIPMDRELWEVENYPAFLEARQRLLADATNALLDDLLHGVPVPSLAESGGVAAAAPPLEAVPGGIADEEEAAVLQSLNEWVVEHGLPSGQIGYELADPDSGSPLAILDLAWPNGLQEGLSEPVAILIGEEPATLQIASDHGYHHFIDPEAFKRYVEKETLGLAGEGNGG